MKKIFTAVLALAFSALLTTNVFAEGIILAYDGANHQYTGDIYSLRVDGSIIPTDVPPIIMDNRTLVPVRALFENMGASIAWDGSSQSAKISLDKTNIELKINDKNAVVNDKVVTLDVAAKLINNRVMVPARFVSEQMNMKVGWLPEEKLITVDHSSIRDIACSQSDGRDVVAISLDYYKNYNTFTLKDPDRLVIDFPNTNAPEQMKTINVNSGTLKTVRYAQFVDQTAGYRAARVVLDLSSPQQYSLEERDGQLLVYIDNSSPGTTPGDGQGTVTAPEANLFYTRGDNQSQLVIAGAGLYVNGEVSNRLFRDTYDAASRKYILTFSSSLLNLKEQSLNLDDNLLSNLDVVKNANGETSIILTGKTDITCTAGMGSEPDKTVVTIAGASQGTGGRGDGNQFLNADGVTHSVVNGESKVSILLRSYAGYKVMRLTSPDRVVIDIPNTNTSIVEQKLDVGGSLVKSVRFAQNGASTARVVIDLNGQQQYRIAEEAGCLAVYVSPQGLSNITYSNTTNRVGFILKGTWLTEGDQVLNKLYTGTYDPTGKIYTVTFPTSLSTLGTGTMTINDAMLNYIQVVNNPSTNQTSIIFNAKDKFTYDIMTRPYPGDRSARYDTAITLLKPAAASDRLVVIDAGHGGIEFGAVYGGVNEKDLNLSIANKLNALLKSKGVKTYMIREDDSTVDLYERSNIANELNAALFLSVHNNVYNGQAQGTETYYLSDDLYKSKRFASIVQSNLTSYLGTYDRGIKTARFVVIRETFMPAVLAEVVYMDNDVERANIMRDDYQQKAAQALCDAVIQMLGEIN